MINHDPLTRAESYETALSIRIARHSEGVFYGSIDM